MIAYRIADAIDRPFVRSGWSASFRTSHTAGLIAMDDWERVMHPQIDRLLDWPSTVTLVAYDPAETDRVADLAGFLCYDRERGAAPLVHYCYVRTTRRHSGVARGLFRISRIDPASRFLYTCSTAATASLARAGKLPLAKWSPLAARFNERLDTNQEKHSG